MSEQIVYRVGISKSYFRPEFYPKDGTEFFEVVQVSAIDRFDAAAKVWVMYREIWRSKMIRQAEKIYLHVNDPSLPGNRGVLNCPYPIRVHPKNKVPR